MAAAADGPIAFVFAMPIELEPLVGKLSLTETELAGAPVHRGTLNDRDVVAIVTGMGTELATAVACSTRCRSAGCSSSASRARSRASRPSER